MVSELAILEVKPGQEAAFESAFDQAKEMIAASDGFLRLNLEHCLEHPRRYMLRVGWEQLEDHTEGFRGSTEYEEWRSLLHDFYVEHYTAVVSLAT
jgi:heme-degrading monooxygenase HmoA